MIIVVTGANGLVGSRLCVALAHSGANVRAVVRRPGTAPTVDGVTEHVGDFTDAGFAATALAGADAAVSTVHPMASDGEVQRRIGVVGTTTFAQAAAAAGVQRLVHVSTAAVYDRSPAVGDVDETSALVGENAGEYALTKRDADLAIGTVNGLTRILLRPPAILGSGKPQSGTRSGPRRSATSRQHGTPCRSRPSPGCTSTTWSLSPPILRLRA